MTAGPRRHCYVDTSAYLCLLLRESGATSLEKALRGAVLCSSVLLLLLETSRNLVRLSREGLLSVADLRLLTQRVHQDRELFLLRDLTLDLCSGLEMPAVSTPRSLDLAHLRTAMWFHAREPLRRFVTLDEAQADAAREFGLPA